MNGVIKHTDVPELWTEKMKAYLGLSTEGNFKMVVCKTFIKAKSLISI